jgi:hypothetical protein
MKKLKYVKIWESFVNEEFTVGNRMTSNLFVMTSKLRQLTDEKEKAAARAEIDKTQEELKKYLSDQFDIDISYVSTNYGLSLSLNFPEGFFKKLGRFFGLGDTKVSLTYRAMDLEKLQYTETKPGSYEIPVQDLDESISLYIGAKRTNVGEGYEKEIMHNEIELKVEDANKMLLVIKEINPATQIRSAEELVKRMNTNLQEDYTDKINMGKTNPNYSFAAVNKVVLVA